jgi:acid phosphatase
MKTTKSLAAALAALSFAALMGACATEMGANASAPASVSEPANLGALKTELKTYHDSGAYDRAISAVTRRAELVVVQRASQVTKPALVLDIDETSLTNWGVMAANDFGYIPNGGCDALPHGPCGQLAWDASGQAAAIAGTLALYHTARDHNVAVFFITGRPESERAATESNLHAAGYTDFAGLAMRPAGSHGPVGPYKSGERARIEAGGYTIIANVGDQQSDLSGGHAERAFKLPNPYYFIP